jgi:hypothetical protein
MTLEKEIEKKFVKKVKKDFGAKVVKFKDAAQVGGPDRLILLPGAKAMFIEMKRPDGIVRKPQFRYRRELLALGFPSYICDSWEEAYERVREHA